MDNKITMDGKYAYRKDPFTQVRILCVDRPGGGSPVISMDDNGITRGHSALGVYDRAFINNCDLVPLQEKLPDLWVIIFPDNGGTATYSDKEKPSKYLEKSPDLLEKGAKLIKYIPAPDQTS